MKRAYQLGLVSAALLLVANAVVLSQVIYNRTGEPEAVLSLTERELTIPYRRHSDSSGLSLKLQWRIDRFTEAGNRNRWHSPDWLNAEKLKQLGFDLHAVEESAKHRKRLRNTLERQVLVVLEYDGTAHTRAIEHLEGALKAAQTEAAGQPHDPQRDRKLQEARKKLVHERVSASRLFAVDAGRNLDRLREQYPDRGRYLILQGTVDIYAHFSKSQSEPRGYISRLLNNRLNVALEQRQILEDAVAGGRNRLARGHKPRYAVKLACGRRLEPWIRGISRLDE